MSRSMKRRSRRIHTIVTVAAVLFVLLVGIFAVSVKTASAEASTNKRFKYYTTITVEDGDTLWSIAETHRTEEYAGITSYIKEVQEINHLTGSEIISGSTLVIPYYSEDYKL